jgi:hypothetical protein
MSAAHSVPATRRTAPPTAVVDLAGEGRELAHGLLDKSPTYVWGVKYLPPYVFASDMLDGLWKLDAITRP